MEIDEENYDNENLLRDIQEAIDVAHPTIYDVYNLCELHTFKVIMLKELCDHFDVQQGISRLRQPSCLGGKQTRLLGNYVYKFLLKGHAIFEVVSSNAIFSTFLKLIAFKI